MSFRFVFCRASGAAALVAASFAGRTVHAAPTAADALKLAPVQKDVDYQSPAQEDIDKCTIKAEKLNGQTGWVVRDKTGGVLRRFVDTNSDNVVDQWCYYQDGLEVYRDIDADYNGKPDQCRWFNTAGTRWGLDTNEDGKIDRWKEISAEEAADELVHAIAEKDLARFTHLLITPDESKLIGLGDERVEELQKKATAAIEDFKKLATTQKTLTAGSRALQFGGSKPALVPAGTDGSTKDVVVYENAVVVADSDGKHVQMQIPSLVRVGETWRLIGAPAIEGEGGKEFSAGVFLNHGIAPRDGEGGVAQNGGPPQDLLDQLEQIDKQMDEAANPEEQAQLADQKARALEKIAAAVASAEDRALWTRQTADYISATVQSGIWPAGVDRLKALHEKLAADAANEELAAYVEFRCLNAEYGRDLQGASGSEEFAKVQAAWLKNLEQYVADHPKSADTAEAMLQLAIAQEFAGQEEETKKWYARIRSEFPDSPTAKKANGALVRLDCVGKSINLRGTNVNPALAKVGAVDIAALKDKAVLIQYWATWCEPALVDMAQLKEVQQEFAKDGLVVIGVSLDNKAEDLRDYLSQHKLPWPQLFEPGGLDSRLANEMGILTLPTMILIGKDGKVVNRGVHITDLEREVTNMLRPATAKRTR